MPDYYQRVEESTEKSYRISQSDAVGEIIGSVISIVLILNWTEILQWLVTVGVPDLVPLPNPQVIAAFAPFLVMLAVASVMIASAKLTVGKWNYVLATLHTLHGALDAGLFLLLATSGYLLRHESISAWASALGRSTTQVQIGSSLGLTLIGLLIAVGVAIDSVRRWVQARRAAQFAPRARPSQPS